MLLNMGNLYLKLNLILVQTKVRSLPLVVVYACHMNVGHKIKRSLFTILGREENSTVSVMLHVWLIIVTGCGYTPTQSATRLFQIIPSCHHLKLHHPTYQSELNSIIKNHLKQCSYVVCLTSEIIVIQLRS